MKKVQWTFDSVAENKLSCKKLIINFLELLEVTETQIHIAL